MSFLHLPELNVVKNLSSSSFTIRTNQPRPQISDDDNDHPLNITQSNDEDEDDVESDDEEEDTDDSENSSPTVFITVVDVDSCKIPNGKRKELFLAEKRLENVEEIIGELEEFILRKSHKNDADDDDDNDWGNAFEIVQESVDVCREIIQAAFASICNLEEEISDLEVSLNGKEERIRSLEDERGRLMDKVKSLQLQTLAASSSGESEVVLTALKRVEGLEREVKRRKSRENSGESDCFDELLEKVSRPPLQLTLHISLSDIRTFRTCDSNNVYNTCNVEELPIKI